MKRDKPLILVVDDETHILHVVRLKLAKAGFDVITAEDGEEGLHAALAQRPDLIITDYQMPFMSGLEMCTALNQHETTCSIPALMLTARGFTLAGDVLEQTNILSVISKPFSPREILARVCELVGPTAHQEVAEVS